MKIDSSIVPFKKLSPIEILLIVLFLLAPCVYFPNIGGTGLRIPNNITVWFVANIIIWYSVYYLVKKRVIVKPKYFIFIAAFPILATVSGFISDVINPIEWFFRLLYIWLGLLFFLGLFQFKLSRGRIDRILFFIVISALIQAIVGVIQVSLPQYLMPFGFPSIINQSVIPYGFFRQINNQATFQSTGIVIASYLLSRPYITNRTYVKKLVLVLFFTLAAFVISLSGSRVGVLTVILSLLLIIPLRWKYLVKRKTSLIAVVGVVIGIISGSSGLLGTLDKTQKISEGYSANHRLGIYAVSVELIKKEPVFGHGIGSFKKVWQFEKINFYEKKPGVTLINQYVTHPHNEFLFWAVEGGGIVVIGLLLVLAGVLLALKENKACRQGVALACLLPITLHTQVELPFYTSAIHWFLTLFLLFVLMKGAVAEKALKLSGKALSLVSVASVVMFCLGAAFLAHTAKACYELGPKKGDLWSYEAANSNPYFRDIIESLQMRTMLSLSVQHNRNQGIHLFINWAEDFILREPSSQMFIYLAAAYDKAGKKKKMCNTFQIGSGIYPSVDELTMGMKFCEERISDTIRQ